MTTLVEPRFRSRMSSSSALNHPLRPRDVPVNIGIIVVFAYILLHMVWTQVVYGPYSYVVMRAIFLSICLGYLSFVLHFPIARLIGTFQLPKRKDLGFFLSALSLVVVFRVAFGLFSGWICRDCHVAAMSVGRLLDDCVLPPLSEEPVFRGLMLVCLSCAFGRRRWQLAILSAAIFAVCHNRVYVVPQFVLGTITAVFFLRTKSISGCMVLHATWNAGEFVML